MKLGSAQALRLVAIATLHAPLMAQSMEDQPVDHETKLLRVVDASGLAISGATVAVCERTGAEPVVDGASAPDVSGFLGAYALLTFGPEAVSYMLDGCAAFELVGLTDPRGFLSIDRREPYIAYAEKAGVGSSGLVSVDLRAPRSSNLVLRPRGLIQGGVADFAGESPDQIVFMAMPVEEGAKPRQPMPIQLDEDGMFSFEVDAPCKGRFFVHYGSGWQWLGETVVQPGEIRRIALVRRKGIELHGTVVDEAGNPVTSGIVRGFPWWLHMGRSADIDITGRFTLEVPLGDMSFAIEAIGSDFMSPDPVAVEGGDQAITLMVSRRVRIRGRVVDGRGTPVAGAYVDGEAEVDETWASKARSAGGLEGYRPTNAEGRFALGRLVPGCRYRVFVVDGSGRRAEARWVEPGTEDLVLTIDDG